MRNIQTLIIAVTLMLSAGVAVAEGDSKVTNINEFYAIGQVTGDDVQAMAALTDVQLEKVQGGHHSLRHIDIPKLMPKLELPGPCLPCGSEILNIKDWATNPSNLSSRVIGF